MVALSFHNQLILALILITPTLAAPVRSPQPRQDSGLESPFQTGARTAQAKAASHSASNLQSRVAVDKADWDTRLVGPILEKLRLSSPQNYYNPKLGAWVENKSAAGIELASPEHAQWRRVFRKKYEAPLEAALRDSKNQAANVKELLDQMP